jgi:hypothetical protein
MSDSPIELIAVQPYMQLADYRTVDAFDAKIAGLTDRIAAARERGRCVGAPGAHPVEPIESRRRQRS